jgi:hypothetical protein
MEKVDYKKELPGLYAAPTKQCSIITVPVMNYLMIDGQGDPNTSADFQAAVEALFGVAYTLKFAVRKERGIDYGVMPLEGLWWCPDISGFSSGEKTDWLWTLMIMQPECAVGLYQPALDTVRRKKEPPAALPKVRLASYEEGPAAQVMHIGPFAEEGPTIQRLHSFILTGGYHPLGKHHEIYLSDIRRGRPENWKTIIRQPIRRT